MQHVSASLTNVVTWTGAEIHHLLNLVRERRQLYDTCNSDYNNRDIVWRLWSDIARELNKPPSACRDKWTRLRCVYRRIINQTKFGKRKSLIRWQWLNVMAFLEPHLKLMGGPSSMDNSDGLLSLDEPAKQHYSGYDAGPGAGYLSGFDIEDDVKNEMAAGEEDYVLEEADLEDGGGGEEGRRRAPGAGGGGGPKPVGRHPAPVEDLLKLLQSPARTGVETLDPDVLFFLSIVPDVRQLTPRDKGEFKLKVHTLLQQMLYPAHP